MIERFAKLPASLEAKARRVKLGPTEVPALLAHPDWSTPAPVCIWMHGRTVTKELDAGRYVRWLKAGIAACAIDLPGHGERLDPDFHSPKRTLDLLDAAIPEIDHIVEALAAPEYKGVFDLDRMAIGGMSAGGMVTLRRLCDPHPFICAAVEGTTGDLASLYFARSQNPAPTTTPPTASWPVAHDPARVARVDPMQHLGGWRPIPLLALHSEKDELVPIATQRGFIDALRGHYAAAGADPKTIELHTWPETGAPQEHAGFGRFGNDAKNLQTEFLARHLPPQ
jgi:alpha-beta hydrolase superfamily lysophospholipase